MAEDLMELRRKAALSHRILSITGSMADMTGHVFVRVPGTEQLLVRARNNKDMAPAFVEPSAIRAVDLDGNPTEEMGDYWVPPERFIGTAVFRARPEINCVIHGHPPAQVLCSITGVDIRPIVGSQNWTGTMLAAEGIPVYPRSLLIHTPEIARGLLAALGPADSLLMKGHGNVVVGRTVEEATVRAVRLENLARLCWQVALGRFDTGTWEIPQEDLDDYTNTSGTGGAAWAGLQWDYYVRMLEQGALVPQECTVALDQI